MDRASDGTLQSDLDPVGLRAVPGGNALLVVDTHRLDGSPCPWVTLVTPSFNQARYLRATIESVLSQGYPKLRYIVMDGGSTDGSVDIIREYADRLTHWESGPDGGQTAAIRRGFEIGGGEILNWINSDDFLEPGALWRVAELAAKAPDAAMLAFPVRNFVDIPSGTRELSISVPRALWLENMLLTRRPRTRRHQPGIFLSRTAYESAGGLDDRFHICMDFDLHLRIVAAGGKVAYGQEVVANFRKHADAKTAAARGALAFVREYSETAISAGLKANQRVSLSPLAPLIVSALMAATSQWSARAFSEALRTIGVIGVPAMLRGSAEFAFRRYVLGSRDELP